MRQPLDALLRHIKNVHESDGDAGAAALDLFISAYVLSNKPEKVLEVGMGAAELTVTMIHTLNMLGRGLLTLVDDWRSWRGREPEGIDRIRLVGVDVKAPMSADVFLHNEPGQIFDLIVVSIGMFDSITSPRKLADICNPRGLLLVHGLDADAKARIKARINVQDFESYLFFDHWMIMRPRPPQFKHQSQPDPGISDARGDLYLGLVKGDGYGWGVCSRYLISELSKRRPVHVLSNENGTAERSDLPGVLFQALTNIDFDPMFKQARARSNLGYTFFENELTPKAIEQAKQYNLVIGGSTWCRDRMLEKGVANCEVLIQGIDPTLFYPIDLENRTDRFVIFSGGKFEPRKGQDLVLKAVKLMQDKYPDVWLVNCWYNLWPASARLMSYSRHIRFAYHEGDTWTRTMLRTYAENGLDAGRIITHELLPQDQQRAIYAQTDIGVFPNRCEGGTNLVLMEYMACAKPAIVSYTSGHKDIVQRENALLLEEMSPYHVKDANGRLVARWREASLDELVAQLEYAYHQRSAIRRIGMRAGQTLKAFTWTHSADTLLGLIEKL